MAEIVAAEHDWLGVEDIEHRMEGKSYTFRTIEALKLEHPDNRYSFVLGGDMLADLPRWFRVQELAGIVDLVPVFRAGFDESVYDRLAEHFPPEVLAEIRGRHLQMAPVDVSSTQVREASAAARSALVQPEIADFINEAGLYQ
jgi:nicotinate-nucleotide adenylyltransferase